MGGHRSARSGFRSPGQITMEVAERLLQPELSVAELNRLIGEIPEDNLRLLSFDRALPRRGKKLPPESALAVTEWVGQYAYERLSGLEAGTPAFRAALAKDLEDGLERWMGSVVWSAHASAVSRIYRRGSKTFDVVLDPEAQVLLIHERDVRMTREVQRQLDPPWSMKLLEELQGEKIDLLLHDQVRRSLAATVPAPALALLVRAGTRLHVVADADELDGPHRRLRMILGERVAWWLNPRQNAVGSFSGIVGELKLYGPVSSSVGFAVGTARHELCHAIDHALGQGGRMLSAEPGFTTLYERQRERASAKGARLLDHFPTPYSASSAVELFAEAGAIYLDRYYDERLGSGGAGDIVATRADLLRVAPDVHRFMEEVFERRIPDALRQGRVQPYAQAVKKLGLLIEDTRPTGLLDRLLADRERLLVCACAYALRGRIQEDAADEREAIRLARQANAWPRRWRGRLGLADELAERVERRRQAAEGGRPSGGGLVGRLGAGPDARRGGLQSDFGE